MSMGRKANAIKLTDLYFGYRQFDANTGKLQEHNLFGSYRVLYGVALYVVHDGKYASGEKIENPLSFLFSDTRGRCEYEFVIEPWAGKGEQQKVDIYTMYVEPNRKHLLELVSRVSKNSAVQWLRKERRLRLYGRQRTKR